MIPSELFSLNQLMTSAKRAVVVIHWNPDGDALGSGLAWTRYLNKTGIRTTLIAPNDFPPFLKWMPGSDQVIIADEDGRRARQAIEKADLVFCLDFNSLARTGMELETRLKESRLPLVLIDHHQQPEAHFAWSFSETAMSSTSEMIFHLIMALGGEEHLDEEMAGCLYAGILTDTGSFRFSATTATTHRAVARLLETGVKTERIYHEVYDRNKESRLRLLSKALEKLTILPEYRTSFIVLSAGDLKQNQYEKGDTEGFVNYGLSLDGICFTAMFTEQDDRIRISFRSKGSFDVNRFAREHFQGGGHINAAGGSSHLSLDETISRFIEVLPAYKKALQANEL